MANNDDKLVSSGSSRSQTGPSRRALIGGLLFAPAIVRAQIIMPVRSITPVADRIERVWARGEDLSGETLIAERPLVLTASFGMTPSWNKCRVSILPGPGVVENMITITGAASGSIAGCYIIAKDWQPSFTLFCADDTLRMG